MYLHPVAFQPVLEKQPAADQKKDDVKAAEREKNEKKEEVKEQEKKEEVKIEKKDAQKEESEAETPAKGGEDDEWWDPGMRSAFLEVFSGHEMYSHM